LVTTEAPFTEAVVKSSAQHRVIPLGRSVAVCRQFRKELASLQKHGRGNLQHEVLYETV